MEQEIKLELKNNAMNEVNAASLKELLNQLGIDVMTDEEDDFTLRIKYDRDSVETLKTRKAGRKQKLCSELTFGDVEELLKTSNAMDIAKLANISKATCYRRLAKLKQYQEEEQKSDSILKGVYRSFNF